MNPATSPCDQICTNTTGSFNCSCMDGYNLVDGTRCVGTFNVFLLVYIKRKKLKSQQLEKCSRNIDATKLPAVI